MSEPVRQHWVPKIYLRNFATPESINMSSPKVNVYDLGFKKQFCTSIDKVLVQKHLYTLGADSDSPLYVVEKTLAKIEGWSKSCIEAFSKGQTIHTNPQSKYIAAVFFATLLMRNPHMLEVQENGFRDLKDLRENSNYSSLESKISDFIIDEENGESLREISDWFSQLDQEGKHIFFVRSIIDTATTLAQSLLKKKWCLLRSVDGYFVTSDNPITVFHPKASPYGICTDGVHIHIAITPRILLLLGGEVSLDENQVYDVPLELVEHMNYLTIAKAERFIISSFTFDDLQNLIRETKQKI
ncbi:MAG: DUF4238 domain-containing protein [Nostoc sp.]|uniref:DUF4238 domain-containing protein n=1 Tax=Nostoc sp. TaxID=1180 RepID=UPI002FF5F6AA